MTKTAVEGQTYGEERRLALLRAVREWPLTFLVSTISLAAGGLLIAEASIPPPPVELRMRTDVIAVDGDAAGLASLIEPVPFGPDDLRDALEHEVDPGLEEGGRLRSEQRWQDDLIIEADDAGSGIVIRLDGRRSPHAKRTLERAILAVIERLDTKRRVQRAQVLNWIERETEARQAEVDAAKAAIIESPLPPDHLTTDGRSRSEHLLRLMIGATTEAQATLEASDGDRSTENRSRAAGDGFTSDLSSLNDALARLETVTDAKIQHGTRLRNAETALANLREDADVVLAKGGVLERPAATMVEAPSSLGAQPSFLTNLVGWQPLLVPTLLIVSLALAACFVTILSYFRPRPRAASDDYLNDPNWPLSSEAQHEFPR